MKIRYRIKEALQFLTFAFYPKITLIACAVFSVIVVGCYTWNRDDVDA